MGEKAGALDRGQDYCRVCGRETPHSVTLEIRTENPDSDNAVYSREPYRVASCRVCGTETSQRMNRM